MPGDTVPQRASDSLALVHIDNTDSPTQTPRPALPAALSAVAVFVAALNLRPAVVSLGTVLDQAMSDLHGPSAVAGLLTALPTLCFGIFGFAAVPIARRLGLTGALTIGMVLELLGLALRPWMHSIWPFVFLTGLVVIGIAVGNILLPAFIKRHGGASAVMLMTVYSTVLGVGSTIGPLSPLPFAQMPQGWRWGLAVWAGAAIVQLLVWLFIWPRAGHDLPPAPPRAATGHVHIWRSRTAIFIMLFFGLQSMNAYVQMGWMPTMLVDGGTTPAQASLALAIVGILQILGGLLMPVAVARIGNVRAFPVIFAAAIVIGYLGIQFWPAQAWMLWSALLGFGGFCFPMALNLITARTRDPLITARLSGFAQPVGYLLAAIGPFAIGLLHGWLGDWRLILWLLVASAVALAIIGIRASAFTVVDHELADKHAKAQPTAAE